MSSANAVATCLLPTRHFVHFASLYVKGAYFLDVHGPLGKLMFATAGWLEGWPENTAVLPNDRPDIGQAFPPGSPWWSMRFLSCLAGVCCALLGHQTLLRLGCSRVSCLTGGAMLALDNALVLQSRLVLLDMPFTAMVAGAAYALLCWRHGAPSPRPITDSGSDLSLAQLVGSTGKNSGFNGACAYASAGACAGPGVCVGISACAGARDQRKWLPLLALGVCLGAAACTKYVALFVIGVAGASVALQDLLPALWRGWARAARMFGVLSVSLILLPTAMYVGCFAVHLQLLPNSGPSDHWMEGNFQASLRGSRFYRNAGDLDRVPTGATAELHAALHTPDCVITCGPAAVGHAVECVEVSAMHAGHDVPARLQLLRPHGAADDVLLQHGSSIRFATEIPNGTEARIYR